MNTTKIKGLWFLLIFCLSLTNFTNAATDNLRANALKYQILSERNHKPTLFTQGFLIKNGSFYESSGLYNKSILVSYPITEPDNTWAKLSAPFTKKQSLPDSYFAEGLALLNNKLYLLTWQEKTVFVYDFNNFNFLTQMQYTGEGWGLATDGKLLIRSDGSENLFFHNPDNFAVVRSIKVTLNQKPLNNLNELEFAEGFIWANVWHDNHIVKINPQSGDVVGVLDASAIVSSLQLNNSEDVLNGIAYDSDKKAFWITGKNWPKMFLIKIN